MAAFQLDNESLLLAIVIMRRRRRRRRRRRTVRRRLWASNWLLRRQGLGLFSNLLQELTAEDPEKFRQFHRLDVESFKEVLEMVGPLIEKDNTLMRSSISPGERLAVTLRFLATGESFRSLSFQFRIGERTLSNIINETCHALHQAMKSKYLKTPTSPEEWEAIAEDFQQKWNYPGCIGALDGKHIAVMQPHGSGSEFFNYKHFFSVILLGLVDANYRFVYVDVGASGRAGDAGVFSRSTLKEALTRETLHLPPPVTKDGLTEKLPYHIVGDDAFPLSERIMKPYPQRDLDKPKRIFNYRLSRARRVVENAFGILANRFRVFLTKINLSPDKVVEVILAACCLHNYMVETNKHSYLNVLDVENADNYTVSAGDWRNDTALSGLLPNHDRNPAQIAKQQRSHLTDYFMSQSGSVPWQEHMIRPSRT